MIESNLSPPVRRFLALGLALLVGVAGLAFIVLPLIGWTAGAVEELQSLRERRARLEAISSRLPARHASETFEGRYLAAPDQEKARLQLQARLSVVAAGRGLAAPTFTGPGLVGIPGVVGARFQIAGSSEALLDWIDALEHGRPRIWLAQWQMRGQEDGRAAVLEAEARTAWETP